MMWMPTQAQKAARMREKGKKMTVPPLDNLIWAYSI